MDKLYLKEALTEEAKGTAHLWVGNRYLVWINTVVSTDHVRKALADQESLLSQTQRLYRESNEYAEALGLRYDALKEDNAQLRAAINVLEGTITQLKQQEAP